MDSGEEFAQIGGVSCGGEKGDEGGDLGAFIGGVTWGRGLGFRAPRRLNGYERCRAGKGLWPGGEEGPDMRVPHVSDGEKEKEGPPSGKREAGPWAGSAAGPDSVPWPFTLFFVLFFFLFLISLFLYNFCKSASKSFKPKPIFF
jgi:hypothetical protein